MVGAIAVIDVDKPDEIVGKIRKPLALGMVKRYFIAQTFSFYRIYFKRIYLEDEEMDCTSSQTYKKFEK
jgi:glucosamine 6-phosphate synthetase-like amidotransferase/phosphosugar isomerase protein